MADIRTTDSASAPAALDVAQPAATSPRQSRWAVAVAALIVVVVAVVMVTGRVALPGFADLGADPDGSIPGTVAYVDQIRDEACLMVVAAAGGQPTEVTCLSDGIEGLAWTADGMLLLLTYSEAGPEILVVDPSDGSTLSRTPRPEGIDPLISVTNRTIRDGSRLLVAEEAAGEPVLRVRTDGATQVLLSVQGPRDYTFETPQWSPDGRWILLLDSRGRILVLGADGTPEARMLVDVGQPAYPPPAWYIPGVDDYTVEPADL